MDVLTNLTSREFCRQLASAAPTPGGGGASALAGALGAALGGMVASLTLGKQKYAAVQGDMQRLADQTQALSRRLLDLVEEDARAFAPLAAAYSLPKATPQEQAHKAEVMEVALYGACLPPLEIMKAARESLDLLEELAEKGSALALSDVGVGATMCQAALQGAILNLLINTASMTDQERAQALKGQAQALLGQGTAQAGAIYARVSKKIEGEA